MSWHLIAGTLVDKLERYNELSEDAQYLFKQYIQTLELLRFTESQHLGVCKAALNACKMLNDVVPGKKANFCWYCGTIEFESNDRTLEDMGWLVNLEVIYSGHLCPTCQKENWIKEFFLNQDRSIDQVCKHISNSGVQCSSEFKENIPWSDTKCDAALAKITRWIKKIYDGGYPYGGAPKKLEE